MILPSGLGWLPNSEMVLMAHSGLIHKCGQCSSTGLTAFHNAEGKQRHQPPFVTKAQLRLRSAYWWAYWRVDYLVWRVRREFRIVFNLSR